MILSGIARRLPRLWYRRPLSVMLFPLLPLSWLFRLLSGIRRLLYRLGAIRSVRLAVPVIVVGNLTVGGSGKTPLVLWLAAELRRHGWRPGIISRGYGGTSEGVRPVGPESGASLVGDEPLLLAKRSGVPVFVGRDRVSAGKKLLAAHPECNVIISDDGLQHYRLQRAAEIVVFDGRGAGNGQLLPAGPLREPTHRLTGATAVVWNSAPMGAIGVLPAYSMRLVGDRFLSLGDTQRSCSASDLRGKKLHAIAGIGDPERFFGQLKALGLAFVAHPFPDHHRFSAPDLDFGDDAVLLMTEKDAVKCAAVTTREAWVLPVDAQLLAAPDGTTLLDTILEKLDGRTIA